MNKKHLGDEKGKDLNILNEYRKVTDNFVHFSSSLLWQQIISSYFSLHYAWGYFFNSNLALPDWPHNSFI